MKKLINRKICLVFISILLLVIVVSCDEKRNKPEVIDERNAQQMQKITSVSNLIEKQCDEMIIFYNTDFSSDIEVQDDLNYSIIGMINQKVIIINNVKVLPMKQKMTFAYQFICGDNTRNISSVLTDVDLYLEVIDFFGLQKR